MTSQEPRYIYEWNIYTDNLCDGHMLIERCNTLKEARTHLNIIRNKYGCCNIEKKRVYNKRVN